MASSPKPRGGVRQENDMTVTAAPPREAAAAELARSWAEDPRWRGVRRDYSAEDVLRLRGSVTEEHTLARLGAERLWSLLHTEDYVHSLGALTGNQAVQQVRAGLKAIYLSGWQVAAAATLSGQTYLVLCLFLANSVPAVVRRINTALGRADQINWAEGNTDIDWYAPSVADAEAGFGGPLNAFELMKGMIAAGAAGVHWENQLASKKKCGHLGGKVLIPTKQHERTLNAARLAADVLNVPSLIAARTDAQAATLLTSAVDERDQQFLTGGRTAEGFYEVRNGIEPCNERGLAYAQNAGLLPRSELLDVRPGARLRPRGHDRLRRPAGARVRFGEPRLHRHQAPARGRHRLLRQRRDGAEPGELHHGAQRLHRRSPVPLLPVAARRRPPTKKAP